MLSTRRCTLSLLLSFSILGTLEAADWPQWRGPNRDGLAASAPEPVFPPAPAWRKAIGHGFSSPVLSGTKLIYLDDQGAAETVHCIDAATGKDLWQKPFADVYTDEWGAGPRSTPVVDGDRLYAQSCNGEFRCLKLSDGAVLWEKSFDKDFGVKFLGSKAREGTSRRRGNNGSPLVEGDAVIIPVGGTNNATLVALDKLTGRVLWSSGTDETAYSSPIVATLAGVKQVVAYTADSLTGFDRETGRVLWRVPLTTNAKRHTSTPLAYKDMIIVNSHTFGMAAIRIQKDGDKLKASEAWRNQEMKINLASPVVIGNYLYCHGPKKDFVCVDANTGALKWQQPGFGDEYSAVVGFEKQLLVLTDKGELVSVAANPERYVENGREQACGKNWNHPAFANGQLYVRDQRELIALKFPTAH